jgi:hypothetical protein
MAKFVQLLFLLFCSCGTSQQEHHQKWTEAKIENLRQQREQGQISEADYKILSEEVYRYYQ